MGMEKCAVCGRDFTHDEVRKQAKARPGGAITQHTLATVHEECLQAYKREMAQQHGPDWERTLDVEIVDAWKVG